MIRRIRLLVLVARPAVIVLLGLFTAIGMAQAHRGPADGGEPLLLARALTAVAGFLVFSVACNDLADEAIDRANLPGSRARPLVTGAASRHDLVVLGGGAAAVALAVSATLRWQAAVVMTAGLALSAGYSLRPVRVADRGAAASLVLPACYVAVPYLIGVLSGRPNIHPADVTLLAGLYVVFIGRILLKDFRDVRGDALFGKRTFLVRHGRRWTCAFSACCWVAGAIMLLAAVPTRTAALITACVALLVMSLCLLTALARNSGARRDEALIAAIAVAGRGLGVVLLAHLSMRHAHWAFSFYDCVVGVLATCVLAQAAAMAEHGPVARATIPQWMAGSEGKCLSGPGVPRR
jgi:4-hydroxybenzoate polyprenyltransferase